MSESEMTVPELIERFENDIICDAHGFSARYGRSAARKELVLRGKAATEEVREHLDRNPPDEDPHNLKTAWNYVLDEMNMAA